MKKGEVVFRQEGSGVVYFGNATWPSNPVSAEAPHVVTCDGYGGDATRGVKNGQRPFFPVQRV